MTELYYKTVEADKAFHDALIQEYGKEACNKRYAPDHTYPVHLQVLSKNFKQAMEAQLNATKEG